MADKKYFLKSGIVVASLMGTGISISHLSKLTKKIAACIDHFQHGKPWDKTNVYSQMMKKIEKRGSFDGGITFEDVVKRYEKMDQLWENIRTNGMKSFALKQGMHQRERRGIVIHIGRHGQPIFGGSGCHRLAIALILNREKFPAQLGVIHKKAFIDGALNAYRHI